MGTVRRYFHRLYPRTEGGMFYCNIIIASMRHPNSIRDLLAVHLRDNRLGLWQRAIDAEQVAEIGWLLYSTRHQDEQRLVRLLSNTTGEHIGARWRVIKTTTHNRRTGTSPQSKEVRAIHLECDANLTQRMKHKVARLYSSSSTNFPDGSKMC